MARGGSRRLAVRSLALLTSLVLTLLLLEGLVRLVGLESASYSSISGFCRYDPHLGWKLIPENKTVFKGRHFAALVESSSQGLRDRYYPLEPEPGRERIVVLGDSVAWCWGVMIEQCFTKLVEAGLKDTDVITMGVPGYSTAQSMLFYERIGRNFKPDRVLFIAFGNDPQENLETSQRPHFVVEDDELVLTNYPVERRKSRLKEWLRNHSQLFVQADHAAQVAQEMLRQWREGRASGTTATKPHAGASQDRLGQASALLEALTERLADAVAADGAQLDIVTVDYPERFTDWTKEYCATRGCRVLAFGPILSQAEAEDRPMRLQGDPHLSPEGNRLLADAVLEFLAQPALASQDGIR